MCKYTPLQEGGMDLKTHFQMIEEGKGRAVALKWGNLTDTASTN